jgi:hypothetical protein
MEASHGSGCAAAEPGLGWPVKPLFAKKTFGLFWLWGVFYVVGGGVVGGVLLVR